MHCEIIQPFSVLKSRFMYCTFMAESDGVILKSSRDVVSLAIELRRCGDDRRNIKSQEYMSRWNLLVCRTETLKVNERANVSNLGCLYFLIRLYKELGRWQTKLISYTQ
jgi:hypothetical protein